MVSACGRYVIVFNGEVYNHAELRVELEAAEAAPVWRGHSDTEVILALIGVHGVEAAVRKFSGMFAFALWDRQLRELWLARDRFGEKPLYYGWSAGRFVFASELKALMAMPGWRGEIDRGAVTSMLRFGYVPALQSIWAGIRKLAPGALLRLPHNLLVSGRLPEPANYWSLTEAAQRGIAMPFVGGDAEMVDELHARLSRSIGRQMLADVPVGAFLSGGVDSSVVVALMQERASEPVRTFSIGFQDPEYNEADHAKAVAQHLSTRHTELYVTPRETLDVIPLLPSLYDEPFADASQVPTYLVARMAREQVTVSLSGDGGDELFGGYNRYSWGRAVWRKTRPWPSAIRRLAGGAITSLSPEAWDRIFTSVKPSLPARLRQRMPGDRLHKLAGVIDAGSADELYSRLVSYWDDPAALVVDGAEPPRSEFWRQAAQGVSDVTQRMMLLDALTYLSDDILVKVDRAAMGVSLETRVPLLDHDVAEFAWSLPLQAKIRDGQTKWPLRQLLYRYVPRELIERPKMGFGIPIDAWLRGPLRDWAESLLDEQRLRREGLLRPEPIRRRWAEHLSGRRNWQYQLWAVLMLQAWRERWV